MLTRGVFDEEHEDFRSSVREFVKREVLPDVDAHASEREIPRHLWKAAGRQGFLGLEIPERYGGSAAGDYRYNAIVIEEFARVNMALASSTSIHFDVVVPYLVGLTTEEQRERWLSGCATGDIISAIGMTEPGAGSDLAALKTNAQRTGQGWLLNGAKTFITNGFNADLVLVAARTTPGSRSKGITLFAVEQGMPGFTRGRRLDKVGQPEADTAELFFEDVFVPDQNVVGELNAGFQVMMRNLPQERLGSAIANVAHAQQHLLETIEYVKSREAFGAPIGSFQHNKFLIADLVTRIEVTQAYIDQCVLAHANKKLSSVDAAKAKWWTAEVQNSVLDHCVQLHGGYGYMNEERIARAWKDARVTKIWAGSNEIMKELIGRDLGL